MQKNDTELEIIAVKIGNKVLRNYEGLAGTFASLAYCCLDKKILPGFHEAGIIAEAELKDDGLTLVLAGKRTDNELMEIMDIAMPNIGAFSSIGTGAKHLIKVISKN
ncbi:MAG TPA: hypothetical protein VMT12_02875 [Syntrophales bacterium]|nr:hypothetical protein [Syntrophales bacterium]